MDEPKLRPATPWAQETLDRMSPEAKAALEREIPEGYAIVFSGRPPDVAAWIVDPEGLRGAKIYHEPSYWSAGWGVLSKHRQEQMIVRAKDA